MIAALITATAVALVAMLAGLVIDRAWGGAR